MEQTVEQAVEPAMSETEVYEAEIIRWLNEVLDEAMVNSVRARRRLTDAMSKEAFGHAGWSELTTLIESQARYEMAARVKILQDTLIAKDNRPHEVMRLLRRFALDEVLQRAQEGHSSNEVSNAMDRASLRAWRTFYTNSAYYFNEKFEA